MVRDHPVFAITAVRFPSRAGAGKQTVKEKAGGPLFPKSGVRAARAARTPGDRGTVRTRVRKRYTDDHDKLFLWR